MRETRIRFLEEAKIGLERTVAPEDAEMISLAANTLNSAVPFLMPASGKLLDDALKGLPSPFNLPFPRIALLVPDDGVSGRRIILATQDAVTEGEIAIQLLLYFDKNWSAIPATMVVKPSAIYLVNDRLKMPNKAKLYTSKREGVFENLEVIKNAFGAALRVICELVEALSCSNVSYRKNARATTKDKKRPFMYDEYYTLMVDAGGSGDNSGINNLCAASGSSGRHVREHLCRGHIRNQPYKDGVIKKIWINAVIKGAKNGGGKINKVYSMKGKK